MTTTTTDIAAATPSLPAIPQAPQAGGFANIGGGDLVTPQITLAQGQSDFLTQREYGARNGDVIWHTDKTDLHFLIGGDEDADSFVGYVVGSEKTAARFYGDGQMEFMPGGVRDTSDPDCWDVWFFHIAVPEIDPILAAKAMFTRSNLPAARQINSIAMRLAGQQGVNLNDLGPVPVKFKTVEGVSKNGEHRFFKYVCHATQPDEDDLETAKLIQENTRIMAAQRAVENQRPQIEDTDAPSV